MLNKTVKQNCKLCGKLALLRKSHVLPSFVYSWLKNTSGTGFLRTLQTPNKRIQDGMKVSLLCEDCEQRLSRLENTFAQEIFHLIREKNDGTLTYGPWFAKFAASVSWRALFVFAEKKYLTHLPVDVMLKVYDALQQWKAFILDETDTPGHFSFSFLPLGMLSSVPPPNTSPNINWYLTRSVDIEVPYSKGKCFVFSKMSHCVILGFIDEPIRTHWEGTQISINRGVVSQEMRIPEYFMDFINSRARMIHDTNRTLSQKQKDTITGSFKKNINCFAESDAFRAINQDFLMFGNKAFPFDADDEVV